MLRSLKLVAACVSTLFLTGCTWSPTSTTFAVRSIGSPNVLAPKFPVGIYRSGDQNTADLYLTDLPLERLADPTDKLTDAAGTILHVHLFLVPAAGKTPIDPTACNVAIRHLVLSRGAVGEYAGGGFLFPSGSPGDPSFGGELTDASMRLARATPNFDDLLGPAIASGTLIASLDERAARAVAAKFETLARSVPDATPAPAAK